MNIATSDHRVLFIDVRETSLDPEKKFKWFRADINLPPFRVGCEKYWQFAKKNYRQADAANAVIVNKYASRIAGRREDYTASQLEEIADRQDMAADANYNKKRKRGPAVGSIIKPAAQKPKFELVEGPTTEKHEEEGEEEVEEEDFEEEDFEELASTSKRRRSN